MASTDKPISPVAIRLQEEMKKRDWKYRDLAGFLKEPLSQVHGWASGTREPSLKKLRVIGRRLRIHIAEFVS